MVFIVQPLGAQRGKFGRTYALNQDYEDLRRLVKSTTGAEMGPQDKYPDTDLPAYYTSGFCEVSSLKAGDSIGVSVHLDNTQNLQKYKSAGDNDTLHFIYTTQGTSGADDFFVLCTAAELNEPGTSLFRTFFPNSVGSFQKSGSGKNRVLTVHPNSDHDRNSLTTLLQKLLKNANSNRQINMQ